LERRRGFEPRTPGLLPGRSPLAVAAHNFGTPGVGRTPKSGFGIRVPLRRRPGQDGSDQGTDSQPFGMKFVLQAGDRRNCPKAPHLRRVDSSVCPRFSTLARAERSRCNCPGLEDGGNLPAADNEK